jgi:hydrogenase maturation protein HypF
MEAGNARTVDRRRFQVRGIVQGVGYRPFVFRTAVALGLAGWVRNTAAGVEIEVEGDPAGLATFGDVLRATGPAQSRVDDVREEALAPSGERGFRIRGSDAPAPGTLVPPDVATCDACLRELFDPADRRHRYPFINCTDCGPRYTIIRTMPYDRARTSMAAFEQCPACRAEYEDPASRRFHAEPNACPRCGPRLRLRDADGRDAGDGDPLAAVVARLAAGQIVAIKGLGGYHLAVDARNERAVDRLRRAKQRDRKPFAVMVRDLAQAARLAVVGPAEAEALASPPRPIVLLQKVDGCELAPAVAPRNASIGAMLPYTPLHHLLMADRDGPLVMTSANPHDEPIVAGDDEALLRLAGLADAFLAHDRRIVARADDSVVRVIGGVSRPVRRSRGMAPVPIGLPFAGPPVLAVGADGRNVPVVTRDGQAFAGPHVGELENAASAAFLEEVADHLCRLLGVAPSCVAHDLHPDYVSTAIARRLAAAWAVPCVPVQHHHAHVLSCLAENGRSDAVVGIAIDGTGYGPDGTLWGGEVLRVDGARFARAARLRPLGLPGGEAAIREPWRLAVWALHDAGCADLLPAIRLRWDAVPAPRIDAVDGLCRRGVPARASGLGRLYDAAAALAGTCPVASYDGEAARSVEAAAFGQAGVTPYPLAWDRPADGPIEIDTRPLIRALAGALAAGAPAGDCCARFESAVVDAFATAAAAAARDAGIGCVALSGGAFQNARLATGIAARLEAVGLEVLSHRHVPANDGGIALGQALAALWTGRAGTGAPGRGAA